ncbi:MAG: DUF1800 domain-containing protein [Verrucomicrobiota bacterium]
MKKIFHIKTQRSGLWTLALTLATCASLGMAAQPLEESAKTKIAAAKVATDKTEAANKKVRELIVTQANAARSYSDTSRELAAAKKILAKSEANAKPAAEKKIKDIETKIVAIKKNKTDIDNNLKAAREQYTGIRRASYPVVAAKAVAEKALAEKQLADSKNHAKNAAKKASAAQAALKTAKANKIAADKSCKDCAAKAALSKKATTGKKDAAKVAADKSAKEAEAKLAAAKKVIAEKNNAVKKAEKDLLAANAAAKKAKDQASAAAKNFSTKTSAAKIAEDTVKGSHLYIAVRAVDDAVKDKTSAQKAADKTSRAEAKAGKIYTAAKKVADKTSDEKAKAKAVAKATATKSAWDKTVAANKAAQDAIAQKGKLITTLQDQLANELVKVEGGLKPMASSAWNYAKARHLMVRAGFGGTPAEVQALYEMGLHKAVDHFVEIYQQPVAGIEFDPARLRRSERWAARLPWDERQYITVKHRNPERRQQAEMRRWWLQRMAESPRPLQEKLTLFWHDHFAVQYQKRYRTYMLFKQNQLFRTYGVDNYGAMLRGVVHDPATISYLDNNVNYKGNGNENLGREILELFSMGEGGGYSEDDLREASRSLTGYNYDSWTGQFRFMASRHDNESKKILGSTGNWSGDDLVDIILRQPATAKYISGKLFKFLAHDAPYDETMEKMAEVMRYNSYDLRPVLKNLFLSEEFYNDKSMGSHIKGPVELAIGAIRDLGIKEVNYASIDAAVNQMGQMLFEPPNVAGWNEGRTWINAERILIRYNQMAKILEQNNVDLVDLLKNEKVDSSDKVVSQLVKACLVVKPDPDKCKALAEFLGKLPPQSEWEAKKNEINAKLRAVLVLLMSSPDSQLG